MNQIDQIPLINGQQKAKIKVSFLKILQMKSSKVMGSIMETSSEIKFIKLSEKIRQLTELKNMNLSSVTLNEELNVKIQKLNNISNINRSALANKIKLSNESLIEVEKCHDHISTLAVEKMEKSNSLSVIQKSIENGTTLPQDQMDSLKKLEQSYKNEIDQIERKMIKDQELIENYENSKKDISKKHLLRKGFNKVVKIIREPVTLPSAISNISQEYMEMKTQKEKLEIRIASLENAMKSMRENHSAYQEKYSPAIVNELKIKNKELIAQLKNDNIKLKNDNIKLQEEAIIRPLDYKKILGDNEDLKQQLLSIQLFVNAITAENQELKQKIDSYKGKSAMEREAHENIEIICENYEYDTPENKKMADQIFGFLRKLGPLKFNYTNSSNNVESNTNHK